MKRLASIDIFAVIFTFILQFNYPAPYILLVFINVVYLTIPLYMKGVLQFIKEKIAIQASFSIFFAFNLFILHCPYYPNNV